MDTKENTNQEELKVVNKSYQDKADLKVVIKAKDMCAYILDVTQKCPKEYRVTFANRLQNHALDIITDIYLANEIFVASLNERNAYARYTTRLDYQRSAITKLRLVAYISQVALERKILTMKQYRIISEKSTEIIIMLAQWIKADKSRLEKTRLDKTR